MMNPQIRLRRLSGIMGVLAIVAGVAAVVVFAAYWLMPGDLSARLGRDFLVGAAPATVPMAAVAVAIGVSLVLLAIAEWGIWSAYRLFRGWRTSLLHPPEAGRQVRNMGLALMALPVAQVIGSALVSVAITMEGVPGSRELAISLDLKDLVIGLTGAVLVALGLVLTDAAALAEENRQFV